MHGTLPRGVLASKPGCPKNRTKKVEPLPLAFRDLARFAYPLSTMAALGEALERARMPRSRSTIATWLSGEHEPPAEVAWLVLEEIMRRMHTRP